MESTHFRDKLSDFVNHELPADERRLIGEHLLVCDDCRREHDEIKFGSALAAKILREDAPEEVWNRINDAIDRPARVSLLSSFLTPAFAGAVLLLIGVASVIFYFASRPALEPEVVQAGWAVETLSGGVVDRDGRLAIGESLETDSASRARIRVADIGNVEIDPNSRITLVDTNDQQHRLSLERGRLSARILAPPRLFIVDTPSAVAVDLGCAYTLEVNGAGDSELHVTSGYVALERDGRDVIVPAGAMAVTRKGGGLGTPFADDSSEEFRKLLYTVDFSGGGAVELSRLLAIARRDDSVSLWHLLRTVPEKDRPKVLDSLAKFVKFPEGTNRPGLLNLDKQMLDALWYEVKIVWYSG